MISPWPHSLHHDVTILLVLLVYKLLDTHLYFTGLVLLKYTWVLAKAFKPLSSSLEYPSTRYLFVTRSLGHYKSSLVLCQNLVEMSWGFSEVECPKLQGQEIAKAEMAWWLIYKSGSYLKWEQSSKTLPRTPGTPWLTLPVTLVPVVLKQSLHLSKW